MCDKFGALNLHIMHICIINHFMRASTNKTEEKRKAIFLEHVFEADYTYSTCFIMSNMFVFYNRT